MPRTFYNTAGRLVNLTHLGPYWLEATYTYTLDEMGNRLAVQERFLPSTTLNYLTGIVKDTSGRQIMPSRQTSPFASPLATPAPFLSLQPPPLCCVLPAAIGDTHVISYTYDPLYRLRQAAYFSGECYQYSYNQVGAMMSDSPSSSSGSPAICSGMGDCLA